MVFAAQTIQALDDLAILIERLGTLASSPPIEVKDVADHLGRIAAQLRSRTLRSGVVGLTKAGKSTTLNALLGKTFLPSSLHPQTAKEVSIVHDPSMPDGALYAIHKDTDHEEELVASGKEDVLEYLYQINKNIRENKTIVQKLVLRVPFPFLSDVKGIKLEVSDTPGLFEATTISNITAESKVVVKEHFAFVIILNLKLLKTQGESELLHMLSTHHPELLVKLKRILVLVNAYDAAFQNTNPESLRPDDIPQYVSDYLAEPGILNITISPENIIPFSALWALRARLWSADPLSLLDNPDAKNLFEESVIALRRAGLGFEWEMEPISIVNKENVMAIAPHLLKFSNIEIVEARLKEMLQHQGPLVLREAVIDDSLVAIDDILTQISRKIDGLELNKKQRIVAKHEEFLKALKDLVTEHTSKVQLMPSSVRTAITAEVNTVTNALRGTIDTVISTQLTNHLQGYHGSEDRQLVFRRICEVKGLIGNPALSEMTNSWNRLGSVVRNAHIESTRGVLTELKSRASLLSVVDTSVANEIPSFASLVSATLSKLIDDLGKVDITTLVSNFDAMNLQVDAGSIPNDQLNHIWQKMETKYRTEQRSKKKKSGFLGLKRKRVKWYESVPYQVHIHGPDINALKSAFSIQATSPWTTRFQSRADIAITEMSKFVSEQVTIISNRVLSYAEQEIQRAIEMSRDAERNAREMISKLTVSQDGIEEIKKQLQ